MEAAVTDSSHKATAGVPLEEELEELDELDELDELEELAELLELEELLELDELPALSPPQALATHTNRAGPIHFIITDHFFIAGLRLVGL